MGKIGDLWVRLGLKKQDFDNGIDQAERRLGGFGKAFNSLKTVALGAFAAIAAAAIAAFKDVALESNKLGDQWKATVGGMQNAWHAFTSSLLSWDWEGFGQRMRGSFQSGKALAGATDALTEQMNSLKMRRADMEQENARLRILMQDQNKSYEERAEAAKKYIANVGPLYQEEADILRHYYSEVSYAWLEAAKLETSSVTRDALERFLKNGAQLTEQMANDPNMVAIAKHYQYMTDLINNQLVDAYVNAQNAAGAFESENRRVFNSLNTATAQAGGGAGSGYSRYNAQRDKAKQIAKQAEDSLKTEEALLKEHYEEDIKLLEKYHIDTTARTQQYWNELAALIGEGLDEIGDELPEFTDELDLAPDDFSAIDKFLDKWEEGVERAKSLKEEFIMSVVGGFSDGVQELTDQLMGLNDVNPGAILQALLSPLADMAVREGEILMAQGLGVEAVKKSLESLQGAPAIAAGAALIAIGAAAKSGLAALAKNGSGTTVADYSGAGTGAGTGEVIRSEMVVRVEGTIKGSDIVLSGESTQASWNR
jgi:hypothetical protein